METDLAKTVRWLVGRAGLAFQCAVPDQFRVLLLVEAVQIFWVNKQFRYLLGSVNLLLRRDADKPRSAATVQTQSGLREVGTR